MKRNLLLFLSLLSLLTIDAQVQLNNAKIKAKIETQTESDGEANGMMMRGPGETNIIVFIKDSLSKVEVKNDFMNALVISNSNSGVTTNLTEAQAEKTGYTTTPADREDQKRRMDSTRKANEGNQESGANRMMVRMGGASNVTNIAYMNEAQVINGINCKKAVVTLKGSEGESKMDVWYTEDYMLPKGVSLGRMVQNFGDLKGIPVQYTTVRKMAAMGNEITMTTTFQITEIKPESKIEAKEFDIPKGYKIKSYQEWLKDNPEGMPGTRMTFRAG